MAETREYAEAAFDLVIRTYEDKYPGTVQYLPKDKDVLLTFNNFPAAYCKGIRTTNPIESMFATIRHRTKFSRGCLSSKSKSKSKIHMMFNLGQSARKRWHQLRGFDYLVKVIEGVKFKDGISMGNADQFAA